MKKCLGLLICFCFSAALSVAANESVLPVSEARVQSVFEGRDGAFVMLDCGSEQALQFNPEGVSKKLAPCSTFKIWNTLIGFEEGVLTSPEQSFYEWDGLTRAIPDWNQNLNLKEAFRVSSVPAYQALARSIGAEAMQNWLNRIGYGNEDISAGLDVFWLPAENRQTILISPFEQAQLLCRLVSGQLPFSEKTRAGLKEIMRVKEVSQGVLYGKTGSAMNNAPQSNYGWFVGYVESHNENYAFAAVVKGDGATGKDVRVLVESLFE